MVLYMIRILYNFFPYIIRMVSDDIIDRIIIEHSVSH
jgi:hypothetical protein